MIFYIRMFSWIWVEANAVMMYITEGQLQGP